MVPISGIVTWKSESSSSRKASNSSSARSTSSISSTGGTWSSLSIASSSGRRSRKRWAEELVHDVRVRGVPVASSVRMYSIWRVYDQSYSACATSMPS